jgi:hypothetical protein
VRHEGESTPTAYNCYSVLRKHRSSELTSAHKKTKKNRKPYG